MNIPSAGKIVLQIFLHACLIVIGLLLFDLSMLFIGDNFVESGFIQLWDAGVFYAGLLLHLLALLYSYMRVRGVVRLYSCSIGMKRWSIELVSFFCYFCGLTLISGLAVWFYEWVDPFMDRHCQEGFSLWCQYGGIAKGYSSFFLIVFFPVLFAIPICHLGVTSKAARKFVQRRDGSDL